VPLCLLACCYAPADVCTSCNLFPAWLQVYSFKLKCFQDTYNDETRRKVRHAINE
jgi:hypothetical protein